MPAIATISKSSMRSDTCGYRAHGALLQDAMAICFVLQQ
jgi:hypothetical protein